MRPTDPVGTEIETSGRLNSWKEIATHFGRSVRCVQQWESEYALPVHRLNYEKKASIYAYKKELDAWRTSRGSSLELKTPAEPQREARSRRRGIVLAAATAAIIVVAVQLMRTQGPRTLHTAAVIRPLAVGPGNEIMPSFSPDGTRVVYVWDGGGDEDGEYTTNIYVKQVDADNVVRLTAEARQVWFPQWSPDGRHIAFYRPPEVLVIPAIGGRQSKLGEARWSGIGPLQTWAGDGAGVITSDTDSMGMQSPLWFLPLDTSPKVRITEPPPRRVDLTPAMSPDGRTLAFTRNTASFANNIFLLPMNGHRPSGPPRQLTFNEETTYFYLTWAQDSQSLFCLRARPEPAVVRIHLGQNRSPDLVPQILPSVMNFLAASPVGNRLAWSTAIYDLDLWRTEIPKTGLASHPVRIAHTMRVEQEPAISPDGASLAFMSNRGGSPQLWLSDSDGGNPMMIDARKSHYPNWSPDGNAIAYEVFDGDSIDIYILPARGGASRRVTSGSLQAQRPVWSRDGRWIYFSSDRSGVREIWRVPAGGGAMVRITHDGGFRAIESTDAKTIYFTKQSLETSLWAMPISGGRAEKLIDSLPSGDAFQVFEDGIYSIVKPVSEARPELVYYPFDTGRLQKVCDVDTRFERQISISADRRWLVYDAWRHRAGDLMMIEGYQ